VRATLPTGDVTFAGARGLYAIERKSLADLVGSLTWGRDRFWREVERLAVLGALGGAAAVIVEGDVAGLDRELADRRVPPWTVVASTLAIVAEGVPVVWAGNRPNAERCALWLLRRWAARVGNGGRS
jgi:ERCC4-type nuclease